MLYYLSINGKDLTPSPIGAQKIHKLLIKAANAGQLPRSAPADWILASYAITDTCWLWKGNEVNVTIFKSAHQSCLKNEE